MSEDSPWFGTARATRRRGALCGAALLALAGCTNSGVPVFDVTDDNSTDERSKPTVNMVVDHVACELEMAMEARLGSFVSWKTAPDSGGAFPNILGTTTTYLNTVEANYLLLAERSEFKRTLPKIGANDPDPDGVYDDPANLDNDVDLKNMYDRIVEKRKEDQAAILSDQLDSENLQNKSINIPSVSKSDVIAFIKKLNDDLDAKKAEYAELGKQLDKQALHTLNARGYQKLTQRLQDKLDTIRKKKADASDQDRRDEQEITGLLKGLPRTGIKIGSLVPMREFDLWSHLIKDYFVSAVILNLQVTNNEGFNPSINLITPFHPVPAPAGQLGSGGTPATFLGNFTLALSGQLDGSQNRTFTQNYLVDLAPLWKAPPENCLPQVDLTSPLKGDLGLQEVIIDGMWGLDTAKGYNIYKIPTDLESEQEAVDTQLERLLADAAKAAKPPADTAANRPAAARSQLVNVPKPPAPLDAAAPLAAAAAAQQVADTGNSQANSVSFGTSLGFTVVEGFNAGPTWTLSHFSGPGGGGGGGGSSKGGGGSGGGGSGSGSGSGGSASQGLFALNRTVVDTVTLTIGATCQLNNPNTGDYWEAVPLCSKSVRNNAANSLISQNVQTQFLNGINRLGQ